ncbi:MAG TPA: right-handed parallel beta-helix repeat-containing protein [Gemmatimonadales bacterium]|nr:right-handed parallel beta-helix repeat-containing protein [Gemmatimonadales bacterium]
MSSPAGALERRLPVAVRSWPVRLWQALRFRDAVVLTAVPLLAAALLLGDATWRYTRIRQFDDWWSRAQSLPGALSQRIHALLALPQVARLRQRFDPAARDPGIIRLLIPGNAWDSLQGDPLALWGEWVDGTLDYGGTTVPVRIRKRGDNSIHWLTDKRTLTIRTPRDQFYKRFRTFGLSVKDVLPAYLANRLAREFGLLAPETEVVPVFLNNRFYGMFRFVEVPDESFLRPFPRMPGNIFRGDRAERGEAYKGVPRNLFENPSLWDRAAASDRWTSAGAGQLELLLRDLVGTTFDDHLRVMARLDREELGRLFAYLLVVGDPYHMDGVHNQLLYEDPSTQRLHPIPWDIRLLELDRPQHLLNDLFRAALRDPWVVDRVNRALAAALEGDTIVRVADSLARSAEARYAPYFEYDRLRAGLVPDVGSAEQAAAVIRHNARILRRRLDDARLAMAAGSGPVTVLDLESRGWVGADLQAIGLEGDGGPGARAPGVTPRLHRDANLNGVLDPGDPPVPADYRDHRLVLREPLPLYAAWSTEHPGVEPGRAAYRFFLTGLGPARVVGVEAANRITGARATVEPLEPGAFLVPGSGWHPWQFPVRVPRTHRFAGTVRLAETLRIPAGDTVRIEAGTTFRLEPDVSVVIEGLVLAQGTAERPIRFLAARPGRPWGALALLGHGADSSRFRYVEFAEGGGALVDRIEYIGMVNVHRAVDVSFEHAVFRDNVRSDDTFHAMHARVSLRHCRFLRANSDAVDFDISDGEIRDTRIEGSGGDGIDLMSSTPRILDSYIAGSGDKGISIGEASAPFVFNTVIEGCTTGIEVKDRSAPLILNTLVRGSGVGLKERRKNWRYGGGGWATVINSRFEANRRRLDRDEASRLTTLGVEGLDTLAGPGEPARVPWLYARYGIHPSHPAIGPVEAWDSVSPAPPIERQRFEDDFQDIAGGWEPGGGTTRLEKRRDALLMLAERSRGTAERAVRWDLAGPATAVLEVAGRDLRSARVVFVSDRGEIAREFDPGDDLTAFRLTTVALPPARYTAVRLEATPRPGLSHVPSPSGLFVVRAGRLDLRGLEVIPDPGPPLAFGPAPRDRSR